MLKYAESASRRVAGKHGAQVDEPGFDASSQSAEANGGAGKVREAIVATEIGMLHPLQMAAPGIDFIPANAEASCVYMKMITLPKLRDALRDMKFEVRVPEEIAARARVPIDRMVAIG
jgi:quinolinate synthase